MRLFLSGLLIASLCLAGPARGQEEPLSGPIADAFGRYERAMATQAYADAKQFALSAWQQAQEADVDARDVGVLAANYGELAAAFGEHEAAYEAWHDAAEIADRTGEPAEVRFARWYYASESAVHVRLFRRAQRAYQHADSALQEVVDPGRLIPDEIRVRHALAGAQAYAMGGRAEQAGRIAAGALELADMTFGPTTQIVATLNLLAGIGSSFESDWQGCALQFHSAHRAFSVVEQIESANLAESLRGICLGSLTGPSLWQAVREIQSSPFPEPDYTHLDPRTGDHWLVRRGAVIETFDWAQRHMSGVIRISAIVSADGQIEAHSVLENELDDDALEIVLDSLAGFRFEPADLQRDTELLFRFDRGRFVGSSDTPVSRLAPLNLHRTEPRYPETAALEGRVGFIVVGFDVDASGRPENETLIHGSPAGVFDRVSLETLQDWRYAPLDPQMPAENRSGLVVQFTFFLLSD